MLFLDNAAPNSCCAERPLHIPTYPRLVSIAATVREKTWEQRHKPTDRLPSLRMRARGLILLSNTILIIPGAYEPPEGRKELPPTNPEQASGKTHTSLLILEHLEVHSKQQWVLKKGKSTTGALLTAIDGWHQALN